MRAAVWTAVRDNDELGIGSEVVRQEMDMVTDQFVKSIGKLIVNVMYQHFGNSARKEKTKDF